MNDPSVAQWACSLVGWAGFAYKLHHLRRTPDNPVLRAVCSTLFLASATLSLSAPLSVGFLNRLTGVPNFAALLVYCLIVALGASAHTLLTYWRHPAGRARRTARRWGLVYLAVVLGLVVLFVLGDAPEERRVDFDTHYATTPYIAEFILLYLLALAAAMVGLIWQCVAWSRVAGRPWLRRGLLVIVAGAVCAMGFSVVKLLAVVARWADADWDALSSQVAPLLAMVGVVISAVGYALPGSGQRLTRVHGRLVRLSAYRALYPLWDALRRATPAIVPPASVPWWDLELRLTRRLAEINDGRLALRAHIDPRVADHALRLGTDAGLVGGPELCAVVEATRIRAALEAKAAGRRFAPVDPAEGEGVLGGVDGVGELAWLVALSRAFADSPVVDTAVARLRAENEHRDGTGDGAGPRDADDRGGVVAGGTEGESR